jgi:methyl-accepting chemotaxis protein
MNPPTLPTTTDTKTPDPRTLTNLQDILSSLSLYQSKEAELSISLSAAISSSEAVAASLSRLQALQAHLDDLHAEASVLVKTVSSTADTARRVGGRVRSLDEEMRRVREASDRISQVIDLKVGRPPFSPNIL